MTQTYYDIKKKLKTIHNLSHKAIKAKDKKYINYYVFSLDDLAKSINSNLDNFSKYLLNKEIKQMRLFLISKAKELK